MIDMFAIGLTHALMALVALRLLTRADLDRDPPPGEAPQIAPPAPETRRPAGMIVRNPLNGGPDHA
ncbi:hypothetical protein GTZ99_13825 [Novosphingobium sp. FSY-8]|uniref:Uncharacterized protein n=1 Tax=Novosphingobium ovatum TaxID=1908523 RepID=A0ABW9XGF3_9SPHN|nr:hypothetical protein [Novosphingobium ovatum]NBC37629.1 hypothetical protein [Novosphingobium ovatum]